MSSVATSNVINSFQDTVRALQSATEEEEQVVMEEAMEEKKLDTEMLEQELKTIKQNTAYGIGEIVFYNSTNEDDWISGGKVIKHLQTDNDGERQYLVDIGNGIQQQFGEFRLSGVSGVGHYSDDDLPILSDNECRELTIRLMQLTKNGLLIWSARSNYNVVFDAVAAHLDHFGQQKNKEAVKAVIENGREVPMGERIEMVLPSNGEIASFRDLPGALYLPRLGVAIIRDRYTELLDLHSEFHCVLTQRREEIKTNANKKNIVRDAINRSTYNRGCWFDGFFYSQGGSLLDWGSRYSGQSITAVRMRVLQTRRMRSRSRIERTERELRAERRSLR